VVNWRPSLVYVTVTLSPGLLLPIAADKSAKESILELSILVIISPFLIPASSAPDFSVTSLTKFRFQLLYWSYFDCYKLLLGLHLINLKNQHLRNLFVLNQIS
jgi:hypothetical protein